MKKAKTYKPDIVCYDFLEYLKKIIAEKKISLRELSKECGTSHANMSYIMQGKRKPSGKILVKIAYALKIDHLEILEHYYYDYMRRLFFKYGAIR